MTGILVRGSPASIQTAIKWDRNNPEYYDALGTLTHFYAVTGNLSESVQFYESATRLSPYDAHFWSDLGAAYDWAGRTDDALNAFQRALRLFPNSPEINWRFANFSWLFLAANLFAAVVLSHSRMGMISALVSLVNVIVLAGISLLPARTKATVAALFFLGVTGLVV